MGYGYWNPEDYASFSCSVGRTVDSKGIASNQNMFIRRSMDESLNPYKVIRECRDSKDHPNSVPIILGLDVTGSMGDSCERTAQTLNVIMTELYKTHQDVQFLIMGIGDLAYDECPLQVTQFESDIRIAEQLDKIYLEKGGGGNAFESYTLAWYFGLNHTELDCFNHGRKGIIITMGDEPMNPYLPGRKLSRITGDNVQGDIDTNELYKEVIKKFDVYHIAVNDNHNSYMSYARRINDSFGNLLGDHLKISTIDQLNTTITDCINESIRAQEPLIGIDTATDTIKVNSDGAISW